MLSLKEWLRIYGNESCCGCEFNNPVKAKCFYKAGYCIRYDQYRNMEKSMIPEQLSLFGEDTICSTINRREKDAVR